MAAVQAFPPTYVTNVETDHFAEQMASSTGLMINNPGAVKASPRTYSTTVDASASAREEAIVYCLRARGYQLRPAGSLSPPAPEQPSSATPERRKR
jgi:hypothetical protein